MQIVLYNGQKMTVVSLVVSVVVAVLIFLHQMLENRTFKENGQFFTNQQHHSTEGNSSIDADQVKSPTRSHFFDSANDSREENIKLPLIYS